MKWSEIRFFKPTEFDSPDLPGSGETGMDLHFVSFLDLLRERVDRPLTINSGFRTEAHNKALYKNVNVPNSAHLRGKAADIRVLDSEVRYLILKYAYELDFKRIEVMPRHIHLDIDSSLPQNVCIFKAEY